MYFVFMQEHDTYSYDVLPQEIYLTHTKTPIYSNSNHILILTIYFLFELKIQIPK